MPTQVDICNMALADIGNPAIAAISDNTKAANTLKEKWQATVDAVLADADWSFALRWVALTLQGVLGDGGLGPMAVYAYAYAKPVGFIRGVRLEDVESEFEEVGDQIHTDVDAAKIQYVRSMTDANKYPPLFVMCLAKRLASEICVPLNQDKQKAATLFDVYRLTLDQAKLANAKTQLRAKDETVDNSFLKARD